MLTIFILSNRDLEHSRVNVFSSRAIYSIPHLSRRTTRDVSKHILGHEFVPEYLPSPRSIRADNTASQNNRGGNNEARPRYPCRHRRRERNVWSGHGES